MFRLKDFITMLNLQNDGLNVCIYNQDGTEIEYENGDKYINLLVDKVKFIKDPNNVGELDYRCDIILSNNIGDESIIRQFIKFDEILEVCKDNGIIMLPVDYKYNSKLWDGTLSLSEHYASESVINIIPVFRQEYTILKVIMADNVQIVHIPTLD